MKEVANQYPESERPDLLEAASSWRLPYWDWAIKKRVPENPTKLDYNVPLVVLLKKVHVKRPTTIGHGDVDNAFYQFTMRDDITMGDSSLESPDKDPLKDLRIHPSMINGVEYPVSTHHHSKTELLTSLSSINAKLPVDIQRGKVSPKAGLTECKIMQPSPTTLGTINGIQTTTPKNHRKGI